MYVDCDISCNSKSIGGAARKIKEVTETIMEAFNDCGDYTVKVVAVEGDMFPHVQLLKNDDVLATIKHNTLTGKIDVVKSNDC